MGRDGRCHLQMYPVAHMGIAVAGVWAGERLARKAGRSGGCGSPVDYRLVALGALIPDAIDKPLYRATLMASDHTIGHTLLFSLVLIVAGVIAARGGEPRLLWLGLGSVTHPLVDPVIVYPGTLLWPLLGWGFGPSPGIPGWYLRVLDAALVAVGLGLWWSRGWFRERARLLVRAGAV